MQKQFATITLIGNDKAGVIARITQLLFGLRANIEALEEQVSRKQFSMTLQASWAKNQFNRAEISSQLEQAARELQMELKFHVAPPGPQRMAILVTRESHVLDTLLQATRTTAAQKKFGAHPVVIIGNRTDLKARAEAAKIPFYHVPFQERAEAEAQVMKILEKHEADFIVLARFMKILSPNFVWRWKNKIINIHPSLLPSFPGANAYRQAYEKGVKVLGVTAHFVTPHLDEGPIIAQEALKVRPDESLASLVKRGQALESKCLLAAVRSYLKKRLDVHWGRVYGV